MVGLKTCGDILLVEYDDEQGNVPDFSNLREPTCPQVTAYETHQHVRSNAGEYRGSLLGKSVKN